MDQESSKELAKALALRANQPEEISAAEYRRLFIKGLAALLREVDSISYVLRNRERRM